MLRKYVLQREAKALRGYYYFELVRTFRNLPLILTTISPAEGYKSTQVSPEEIYAQIEKDLIEAKQIFTKYSRCSNRGRSFF